jgi:phosphate transport system substrate-binding protein
MRQTTINTAVAISLTLASAASSAAGRDHIEIVGSSTVYPFATVVAETFGKKTKFKTPKIESTGSGGGFKLFCAGNGIRTPDITNASRRIKKSEFDKCMKNGVKAITEVQIGYDGIAIANAKNGPQFDLSLRDLYLALASEVPSGKPGQLRPNPYKTWQEVNPALPAVRIEVLGPPPTSGTRDAFAELAMEGGCKTFDWIKGLKSAAKAAKKAGDKNKAKALKQQYKAICHTIREDGAYIEAGENDNLIVQKLGKNPNALGIFGFSFLDQNGDKVKGAKIDGIEISFENIADGKYPVSRPLFFYVKNDHVGKVPGIEEYISEFTEEDTWGEEGYLTEKGLIPLGEAQRQQMARDARALKPLTLTND